MAEEKVDIVVTFRCPLDLKAKLDDKAEKSGKTLSAIVLSYVEIGIDDESMLLKPGELRQVIRSLQASGRGVMARKLQARKRSP
jgi:predicted DNA-binding protein